VETTRKGDRLGRASGGNQDLESWRVNRKEGEQLGKKRMGQEREGKKR